MVFGIKNPWKREIKVMEEDVLVKAGFHVDSTVDFRMRKSQIHDYSFNTNAEGELEEPQPIPEALVNETSMPEGTPGSNPFYLELYTAWQTMVKAHRRAKELGLRTPALDNKIRKWGWVMESVGFLEKHAISREVIALHTTPIIREGYGQIIPTSTIAAKQPKPLDKTDTERLSEGI